MQGSELMAFPLLDDQKMESNEHDGLLSPSNKSSHTDSTPKYGNKNKYKSLSYQRRKNNTRSSLEYKIYETIQNNKNARIINRTKYPTESILIQKRYIFLKDQLFMYYHHFLNKNWFTFLLILFILWSALNFILTCILMTSDSVKPANPDSNYGNKWFITWNFTIETFTTIGYGHLIWNSKIRWENFMVTYLSNIFDALFVGIVINKMKHGYKLKAQIKFSDIAVINNGYSMTSIGNDRSNDNNNNIGLKWVPKYPLDKYSDYNVDYGHLLDIGQYSNDEYRCLLFRFQHLRIKSRMCETDLHLYLYIPSNNHINGFVLKEMNFELYNQRSRIRSMNFGLPLFHLPMTVFHKIDNISPLYPYIEEIRSPSSNDSNNNNINNNDDNILESIEIIVIINSIDESVSNNYQCIWSYKLNEIMIDYEFESMVKIKPQTINNKYKNKQILQVHLNRISNIVPINQYKYT